MPQRIRIAFHSENGPVIGGSDVHMGVLAQLLDPAVWDVWFLLHENYPLDRIVADPDRYTVLNVDTGTVIRPRLVSAGPPPAAFESETPLPTSTVYALRRAIGLTRSTLRLRRYLREHEIDVLHAMDAGPQISLIAAKLAGCTTLATYQAPPPEQRGVDWWLTRLSYKASDVRIAVSKGVLNEWIRYTGLPCSEVRVLYHGIRSCIVTPEERASLCQELALPEHSLLLGFTGRMELEKGVMPMMEALRDVLAHDESLHVLLVGDGSMRSWMSDYAAEQGLSGRFTFAGYRKDASKLAHLVDIALVPSVMQEPLGLVILEAMHAGKPVVASRIGGIPEVAIEGETALLVEPNDAKALASAVLRLVHDPELRERLGRAGLERAQKEFTWEQAQARNASIYTQIAKHIRRA